MQYWEISLTRMHKLVSDINKIPEGWMGLDIGEKSAQRFAEVIAQSRTLLWNGPSGVFEFDKFAAGTKAVAEAIVKATDHGAFSLIGGGDSAAAINKFHLGKKFLMSAPVAEHYSNTSKEKFSRCRRYQFLKLCAFESLRKIFSHNDAKM